MKRFEKIQKVAADVLFVAIGLSTVVTAALFARDRLANGSSIRRGPDLPDSSYVASWRQIGSVGHRMGASDAPVTIVEFGDFQCPACRSFALGPLRAIRAKYGNQVALVFRHWPLPYHKVALPAVRAAECANDQGRFADFHDAIYLGQDSLGIKPFWEFARAAGVSDSVRFARCNSAAGPIPALAADTTAVHTLNGRGTPTILVNGWQLGMVPDSARLDRLVQAALEYRWK